MNHTYKMEKDKNTCIVVGQFASMHRGHKALIKHMVNIAHEKQLKPVVVSLYNKDKKSVLLTEEEKAYLVKHLGVELFISKEASLEAILKDLDVKMLVTGGDKSLEKIAQEHQVDVELVENVKHEGSVITNTWVEESFESCDFELFKALCGHPYFMIGFVEHGKALGRTVGMPTANLGVCAEKRHPKEGVYATCTEIEGEKFKGLTNIGGRPSVDNDKRITIETYLLDFARDLYGRRLVLETHFFIRGVKKFSGLEEVQNQVQKDLDQTRAFFDSH
ncbi:riboflavin kinase [Vallitaleaceae bacterium 9-2]